MKKIPAWQYDEFNQIGVDYEDPAAVEAYDARHARFRDVDAECNRILDLLAVTPQAVVIDLGTGTGAFAIHAAHRCAKVYAVDVSGPMLEFAQQRAETAGLGNITFCCAGFLTYAHNGEPADALVTSMAFHHLPDFWKGIALNRLNGMLKPGGLLYIHDVIFAQTEAETNIARWIDHLAETCGKQLRDEVAMHVREEFSTYDWIMDGLLERAGFSILSKEMAAGVIGTYLCQTG
ncbi:MAG: methyltransferase domain-containing protein [Thermodesulfobacteriota bacterium]|nr:methyltransferase domain-containing protein [Thermodesulfobacteriota bacterium]